jgi:hypothetical protein
MSVSSQVMLGYFDTPRNNLITSAEYTPSKVGGQPAWLASKGIPAPWCSNCEFKLTFLMQLYACIDETEFDEFHRMLYVFVCLSDKCIGTQNAVKVYRAMVPDQNTLGIKFANEVEQNEIWEKTNN